MPIPFDDLTEDGHSGGIAWLRFAEEEHGQGIRAALLQTSAEGDPLAFCFTRIDRSDPSLRRLENPTNAALARLAGTLFRAAAPLPTLVVGADDDLTRQAFKGNVRVTLPCCLITLDGGQHSTRCGLGKSLTTYPKRGGSSMK